jgi:GT2 family glycosyltransferase
MTDVLKAPRVTVVVVTFNCAAFIDKTLESLADHHESTLELVVVDNASSDTTLAVVAERFPSATLIALDQNVGFAEANNIGAGRATGEYLFLLNPDAWIEGDTIDRMTAVLDSNVQIGVLGTKVLHPDGSIQDAGNKLDRLGFPVPQRPTLGKGIDRDIFFASGCGFMTRRADWDRLGGFDGRLFMFCEEVDYCWRMQLIDKDIAIADGITIWHAGGATLSGGYAKGEGGHTTNPRRIYLRERNTLAMFLANASPLELTGMLVAWALNVPEALGFLAMRRFDLARQYPRALAWNARNLGGTLRRRRHVQAAVARRRRRVRGWARGSGKLRVLRNSGIPTTPEST